MSIAFGLPRVSYFSFCFILLLLFLFFSCTMYSLSPFRACAHPPTRPHTFARRQVEEWMPPESFDECSPGNAIPVKQRSSQRFNAMIAPLVGFTLKATLWYQGEADAGPTASNASNCPHSVTGNCDYTDVYACRFGAMINTWRDMWGQGDYAFLYVSPLLCFVSHSM